MRSVTENHLEELFEETGDPEKKQIEHRTTPQPNPDASATDALPTAADEALNENNALKCKDWISRERRQERAFSSGPRKRTADPDATPTRLSGGETKLGYQAHYVVDGDKARVILNVLVTPSEVSENQPLLDLLWRSCFRWRLRPDQVSADGKYGTAENVSAIEQANVRAFVALHEAGADPPSLAGRTSPTTRKGTSTSARPERSYGPWVERTAKQIARGSSPPTGPRPHPAGGASQERDAPPTSWGAASPAALQRRAWIV